ncbi:hypothetical protein [Dictyobacter aurantiacus]|uniref:Uncharacterized protein n=1 Tax=Dictyobacter aurantiacus TaxID=1936993 RepID=A0A401ZDW6_9CHLR|nr:hypothetical protein [Dictyobacter aurantiacus]GCE05029.1 hypothetical protein KDAU_23580 [Dictyobacter aurantiacus]
MKSNQKKNISQDAGRWARVGALSASTLAPVVDAAIERIRAQQEAEQAAADIRDAKRKEMIAALANDAQPDLQERLQSIGTALSDVLADLRERSTNQAMLKRANELTEDFIARSNKFSQTLAERGSDFSHELGKRSSEISHELGKRGSDFSQELGKRSSEFSQELGKRSRKAQRSIAQQDRKLWIFLGFGCGLTVAGIVTFMLVRRRLRDTDVSNDSSIQMNYDANLSTIHVSQPRGEIHAISNTASQPESYPFGELKTVTAYDGPVSDKSAEELAATAQAAPSDAIFVGLASTRKYYPVETPLDQLGTADGTPVDVIYFSSEQEAQTQGFTAANF